MMMQTMPLHQPSPAHHPNDERLLDFVTGAAPEPITLLIATHLALCPRCRREVQALDMIGGALFDELQPETMPTDCLERIFRRIEQPEPPRAGPLPEEPGDPSIPQPLRRYLKAPLDRLPWRRRGAISDLSLLPEVEGLSTRLLLIRAGAAAPRHTHRGSEITLVLKGSFHDAHGHYRSGDVEEADSDVDHRPVAGEEEDCLCLAVTDAPLKLTSPFGRLINPFVKF